MAEIWPKKQNHIPELLSLLVHVIVVTALIVISLDSHITRKSVVDNFTSWQAILLSPPTGIHSAGGGGGGTKASTPESRGILPRAAERQLVPPTPIVKNLAPELMAEPTIIALSPASIAKAPLLLNLGDPNGVLSPPSAGKGTLGGIGDGEGTGVGPAKGPGFGPGDGTLQSDGVVRIGALGASAPTCPLPLSEPNYTDEARRANIQGTVTLNAIVQRDGSVSVSKVTHGIGYGLDDEASQFVAKSFRCKPGIYQGQAVATPIRIDVNFHLY